MEKTLQVLNALEHDGLLLRYAIGGAMAATFYVEPVLTFDLDVFVILPQAAGLLLTLAPLYDALRARGYAEQGGCVNIEGVPVQFLPAYNALLEEALAEARETSYGGTATRVLRAEHLAAIAVQTPSARPCPPQSGGQMEAVDKLRPEIARLIAAKQERRHKLAALPFPEKVRIVVQLQRMAAPILLARGRPVRVWRLTGD